MPKTGDALLDAQLAEYRLRAIAQSCAQAAPARSATWEWLLATGIAGGFMGLAALYGFLTPWKPQTLLLQADGLFPAMVAAATMTSGLGLRAAKGILVATAAATACTVYGAPTNMTALSWQVTHLAFFWLMALIVLLWARWVGATPAPPLSQMRPWGWRQPAGQALTFLRIRV